MANSLDSLFPNKFNKDSKIKSDKILCILEGGDELSFEKESITFFENEEILQFIEENYKLLNGSKCQWYKNNYGKLLQFNPIKNKKKLATIIPLLDKNHFESKSIDEEMQKLINFIKLHFKKGI